MWAGPISSCLPGGGQFAVAYRRRGAFCKGIVSTARRGGLPFASFCSCKRKQNRAKGNRAFPFANLFVAYFSREKNPNPYCAQIRSKGSHGVSAPTALRCPKKSSRCSLARFFRPLRVLHLAASATGGARLRTPYPSPVAGEGPSVPIAARSTHRLGIITSCYRLAVTPT